MQYLPVASGSLVEAAVLRRPKERKKEQYKISKLRITHFLL